MRVLILTQYYAPEIGAPQTRLAAFARELGRRGHTVEVVTAMPHHLAGRIYKGYRRKLYVRERVDGVDVHRTWVYAATGTGFKRMLNYLTFTVTSLIGLFRARRPDVVFVESPPLFLSVPGWIAARFYRSALVFNVADLWPDSVRELGVMRDGLLLRMAARLEAWSYRRADIVNAVTEGIAAALQQQKQVPRSKIAFLPNGIDIDVFLPRSFDAGLARKLNVSEKPVFIYAGTHGIAQGLHHVVDAAAEVKDEAYVLFVGSGPTKPMLVERARRRGATNAVFVEPVPLSLMPGYFSLACASIVPLVRTPLMAGARPSKIFPSLACGVPVLYCGEGESAGLLTAAGAGLVVPPEDAAGLAAAMRALVADRSMRNEMSVRARRLAVERFAWSSIVGDWLRTPGLEAAAKRQWAAGSRSST
jgi:colanic acid biosynthesis glycosyl transferase WcaI